MQATPFSVRPERVRARGFTMVELMAVVVIIGILATLAAVRVRKYVLSSKTTEAIDMIASIKGAQEAYKDETFSYLNVSPNLTSASSFYPDNPKPGQQKMNFAGAGAGMTAWDTLGVKSSDPVLFVYACTAGATNTAPSSLGTDITVGNWPSTLGRPWYVVKARADLAGDGTMTVFASTSFANELYSANP